MRVGPEYVSALFFSRLADAGTDIPLFQSTRLSTAVVLYFLPFHICNNRDCVLDLLCECCQNTGGLHTNEAPHE